jgi:O-antigen ligase
VPIIRHRFTSDLSFFFKKKEDNNPGTGMFTRLHYWSAAASAIKSDPVIGVGTGDVQDTLDKHYTTYAKEHALGFNAHNQYLQTAVMLGFIGTISLVLLLAFALKYGFKHKNHNLIYLLILVSLVSMTEAILQVNKGIVFFSLFISILMFCAPAIEGYAQSEPE